MMKKYIVIFLIITSTQCFGHLLVVSDQYNSTGKPVLKSDLAKKVASNTDEPGFYRNVFSYHLFDLVFNDFTISYEHISQNGLYSFQIPLGVGFRKQNYYYNYNIDNTLYSGVGLYYYPFGQKKFSYYLGPEFRFGFVNESHYEDNYNPVYHQVFVETQTTYFKYFFRNGIMYMPIKNLSFSANFGLGIKYYKVYNYSNKTAHFAVNLGYRF